MQIDQVSRDNWEQVSGKGGAAGWRQRADWAECIREGKIGHTHKTQTDGNTEGKQRGTPGNRDTEPNTLYVSLVYVLLYIV